MTKTELEKKPLSDLHELAAEAGIEKYRMLTKAELVERLAGENGDAGSAAPAAKPERAERPRRPRRELRERSAKAPEREPAPKSRPEREPEEAPEPEAAPEPAAAAPRPRRRRRRRFGRRSKGVTLQTLLLPPEAGRQTLVLAETREGCTALLRGVAADLAADSKGPDPVALLIDPSPEELADWKRDAPQAEIVSAGQPRHAADALAQAAARAGKGEDVILLVDSLTRLAEAHGDAEAAKELFDASRTQGAQGGGSLTVVAALERPS
ncbi:MAG TPA: Rho termination factor N-terminal domain-containing protein [Solirubrobacterales bacterium]|nr:Rho termination factor N-terminal domain-containing protein [Solirubrobacterales bacterium]